MVIFRVFMGCFFVLRQLLRAIAFTGEETTERENRSVGISGWLRFGRRGAVQEQCHDTPSQYSSGRRHAKRKLGSSNRRRDGSAQVDSVNSFGTDCRRKRRSGDFHIRYCGVDNWQRLI